jgi:hypothetical protein
MSKARDLANLLGGGGSGVPSFSGTGAIDVPAGTTAQRPTSPNTGYVRFNTTLDQLEQYTDESGWQGIAPPPTITSLDVTNVEESDTTQTIVITGQNFDTAASAVLVDANGTTKTPTTSTRNSSSQITIVFSGGDVLTSSTADPLDIRVNNGSGLSATLEDAITVDATPTWTTATGSVATLEAGIAMTSVQLAATDPEGGTVTYSVTSGALPSGLSLSSSGAITGTPTDTDYSTNGPSQTHNFTVSAADGTGNTTPRAFSIVRQWLDGSTSTLAARSALDIKGITGTTTNGFYYIKPEGYTGNAIQVFCDMANDGGGWMLMSAVGTDVFWSHVDDAAYNVPFNANSTAVNGGGKTSSGWAGNCGQAFIDALVVANRQSSIARFNIHDSGTTWRSYFFPTDANARWYDIYNRSSTVDNSSTCDATRKSLAGNQWLRSCYYGYTADSGNGGAGTVSGTNVTQGSSCWGTFPYNMDTGDAYGENWGYSIAPNYQATFTNRNTEYMSCHSNGWNRAGNFWFKAG